MTPWHEDDAFWESLLPVLFPRQRWESAAGEVDHALGLLGAPPGSAVLDLCCGVGRHSLELARRGFRVTGVDRTEVFLRQARERARAENLHAEWLRGDMRTFSRHDTFDAAISLWTSFGYFEDPEEDRRVLRNVHDSLKNGGAFLVDMLGKEIVARNFRERDWHPEEGDRILLEERWIVNDWTRIENRWILLEGAERREWTVAHPLYGASDLRRALTEVGFGLVTIFGDLAGAPYDHAARRLVAVARKGATSGEAVDESGGAVVG